jgi:hypothetical protein
VSIILDWWMRNITTSGNPTTDALIQNFRGYFLHQGMWELRWNQKPKVYKPEFKGGSYEAAMDAIIMLVCKNPLGEGKYAPAT